MRKGEKKKKDGRISLTTKELRERSVKGALLHIKKKRKSTIVLIRTGTKGGIDSHAGRGFLCNRVRGAGVGKEEGGGASMIPVS